MKKLKKFICALLCLLLIVSMFSACGNKNDTGKDTSKNNGTTVGDKTNGTNTSGKKGPFGTVGAGVTYVRTEKNSVQLPCYAGFIYRADNSMYGVKSTDGSFDSGAIYYDADTEENLFVVQTATYADPSNLESINCTGVIDENGKVIIPTEYALIKSIGEHYLQAYKVTGITTDAENYLVRLSGNLFSLTAEEGDVLYTGTWCVYDTRTGKLVPGVAGTTSVNLYQNGDVLTFTENGQKVSKNAAGEDMPQDARMFLDGSYIPNGESAVYGPDKQKRFDFTEDDYEPISWEDGYYLMSKYKDGTSYVLADETGKVCSTSFNERPSLVEGGLVAVADGLYDMQGKLVLDKPYLYSAYCDGSWLIRDENKNVYLMDSSYQVKTICQLDDEGVYSVNSDYFAVTKKEGSTYYYYSVTQNAFVEGNPVARGVAEKKAADDSKILLDMKTDTELLSGYSRYDADVDAQGVCYIYAYARDAEYNTFCDLFVVK